MTRETRFGEIGFGGETREIHFRDIDFGEVTFANRHSDIDFRGENTGETMRAGAANLFTVALGVNKYLFTVEKFNLFTPVFQQCEATLAVNEYLFTATRP